MHKDSSIFLMFEARVGLLNNCFLVVWVVSGFWVLGWFKRFWGWVLLFGRVVRFGLC
jgi:hypothetical protein